MRSLYRYFLPLGIGNWLVGFLVFVILRLFEQLLMCFTHGYTAGQIPMGLLGIFQDLSLAAFISLALLPLAMLFAAVGKRSVIVFLSIFWAVVTIIGIMLVVFFQQALKPLDGVVFQMSPDDMIATVGNTLNLSIWLIVAAVAVGALVALVLWQVSRLNFSCFRKFPILLGCFFGTILAFLLVFPPLLQQTPRSYFYDNKFLFPFTPNLSTKLPPIGLYLSGEALQQVEYYQRAIGRKNFVNSEYPFLTETLSDNPVGGFFRSNDSPPNIVIVIIESLGTFNSYPNPLHGVSFTPFIDSLARHGLFWNNFYANHERTFGVLPTILGSLPSGEKGFNELREFMPRHVSLPRLLGANGYYTSFFYGGWLDFDQMRSYLMRQNMHRIESETSINNDVNSNEFSWGDNDHVVYERCLPFIKGYSSQKPRLDIFLTLSTHEPYRLPNPDFWANRFYETLDRAVITNEQRNELTYKAEHLQSLLFADSALHFLFNEIKGMDRFDNTIFIITGDHSLPFFNSTYSSRYHVPLIIFSPQLKRSAQFDAFGSQLDITPTLASLLAGNFGLTVPKQNAWLGMPLDTGRSGDPHRFVPIMRTNRECTEYIFHDTLFAQHETERLVEAIGANTHIYKLPQQVFYGYRIANSWAVQNDALIPPEAFRQFANLVFCDTLDSQSVASNLIVDMGFDDSPEERVFTTQETYFDLYSKDLGGYPGGTVIVQGSLMVQSNKSKLSKLPSMALQIDNGEGEMVNWEKCQIKPKEGEFKMRSWNLVRFAFHIKLPEEKMDSMHLGLYLFNPKNTTVLLKSISFNVGIEMPFDID